MGADVDDGAREARVRHARHRQQELAVEVTGGSSGGLDRFNRHADHATPSLITEQERAFRPAHALLCGGSTGPEGEMFHDSFPNASPALLIASGACRGF